MDFSIYLSVCLSVRPSVRPCWRQLTGVFHVLWLQLSPPPPSSLLQ